jgi:DNA-binding NtrC family response regulator
VALSATNERASVFADRFSTSGPSPMNRNSEQSKASRRILLVAASGTFREWSLAALREAGYCTQCVAGCDAPWEALRRTAYRLIVVEHSPPRNSGLRLVIRMSHANLTLPVLLVTEAALPLDQRAHRCFRSVTVLAKPFGADRLIEIVVATLLGAQSIRPYECLLPLIEAGGNSPHHMSHARKMDSVL